jgi:hypothetical protein
VQEYINTQDYLNIIEKLPDVVVILIALFLFINALAWFFLPFAIFGIKAKMNRAHKVNDKILEIMQGMK